MGNFGGESGASVLLNNQLTDPQSDDRLSTIDTEFRGLITSVSIAQRLEDLI